MKFIKPGSIEFPTCTLLEKNCWKPLVAVKITQVCNGRLHNGLVPKGLKKTYLTNTCQKVSQRDYQLQYSYSAGFWRVST